MPEAPDRPLTWKATRERLTRDRERLVAFLSERDGGVFAGGRLHPSYVCVRLYRTSRYFHLKGRTLVARLVGNLNTFITGADIGPATDIGEGLIVLSPAGTALYGKAGRNLTLMPCSGFGGEIGRYEDVGGGKGLPVLGDDVVMEPHAGILGPCRVGSRVRVGSLALVLKDVPDDSLVEGPRVRIRRSLEDE